MVRVVCNSSMSARTSSSNAVIASGTSTGGHGPSGCAPKVSVTSSGDIAHIDTASASNEPTRPTPPAPRARRHPNRLALPAVRATMERGGGRGFDAQEPFTGRARAAAGQRVALRLRGPAARFDDEELAAGDRVGRGRLEHFGRGFPQRVGRGRLVADLDRKGPASDQQHPRAVDVADLPESLGFEQGPRREPARGTRGARRDAAAARSRRGRRRARSGGAPSPGTRARRFRTARPSRPGACIASFPVLNRLPSTKRRAFAAISPTIRPVGSRGHGRIAGCRR